MATKEAPGFKAFELPVMDFYTPHTRHHLSVRSLTVTQEEAIKSSPVSPSKLLTMLNQLVYSCIVERNAPFDSFEGFETNLSITDREAALFTMMLVSYGDEQEFNVTCPTCGKVYEAKGLLSENVDIKMYSGAENLLAKKVEVELPVSKYKAYLGLPTLADERMFAMSRGVPAEVLKKADDFLIVKELHIPMESSDPEKVKYQRMDNTFEIYSMMQSLPVRDRKAIIKAWRDAFGDYGVSVKIPATCPNCSGQTEVYVSLLAELFRLSQG